MPNNPLGGVFFDASRRTTLGTEQARDDQVKNNQGGFVFEITPMDRARRFLILGSESSFYQSGSKLSMENATNLQVLAKSDQAKELVDTIVDISVSGRAPKQSPGLFALAVVISQAETNEVRSYAYSQLSKVARTASTLFEFLGYLAQFKPLGGTGLKKAIGRWYMDKPLNDVAYQMVKYRQRNGYDHSRALRLSKYVKSNDRPELNSLLDWALGNETNFSNLPDLVKGFEIAKRSDLSDIPMVIRDYRLSWEMLPTEALNDRKVWEAMLNANTLPLGALIRQLPRLTNLGIIAPLGGRTTEIVQRLTNRKAISKARIHPIKALNDMRVYASGQGEKTTWTPVQRIVDALEEMFYLAFDFVEPTNENHFLALDLSASMTWKQNEIRGMKITPREASAVMAMVTARIEPEHYISGFSATDVWGQKRMMIPVSISPKMRLNDAINEIQSKQAGGTDLSLPIEFALATKLPVKAFVIYTDNETGYSRRHPFQALREYRDTMGINAKLIVSAMSVTNFTIADPRDPGMMDIAGFDSAAPSLIADFVRS